MTRLRIAWARYKRNWSHWKELEEAYETIAGQECEKQRLRNEVAQLLRDRAELEAELRAYQGVA
jgi:hypothetical protein